MRNISHGEAVPTNSPDSTLQDATRFDAWLWQSVNQGTASRLRSTYLDLRDPEAPEQITVVTVLADGPPLQALSRHANLPNWPTSGSNVEAMLIEVEDDHSFVVSSWGTSHKGVYNLAATVPVTDRRWKRVQTWLSHAAPQVVPVYLDRRHFEGFISVLAEFGSVDVSRLTGRYRGDQSSYSRGWPNPKPAREALEEVDRDVQLRTMSLSVLSDPASEVQIRLHLRREAGATFYSGDFGLFERVVLARLANAVADRGQLLAGRARSVGAPTSPPVEVRIGAQRFDFPDSGSDFFTRLISYRKADTAVLHRNPYMHVVVTDYLDGSNFDVVVTEADKIAIHPGYAASVAAMVRLTTFLSEEFEADAVVEQEQQEPVSLDDLFSTR